MNKNTSKKKHLNLDLLSFVSHELKTPLSTLKLNVEILKTVVSPKEKRLIEIMDEEIDWMIQFISNTLDLRKVGTKATLNISQYKWNKWFQTIKGDMQKKAGLLDRVLKFHSTKQEIEVSIDPFYIKQAVWNLILNAIEHSPKNSTIEILWKLKNGYLETQVIDEGPGLSLKDKDKIFKPFYKERKKKNQIIKSTGLGLTIVQEIIQAHGGKVYAQNRLKEKGAVFTFTLPYHISF